MHITIITLLWNDITTVVSPSYSAVEYKHHTKHGRGFRDRVNIYNMKSREFAA